MRLVRLVRLVKRDYEVKKEKHLHKLREHVHKSGTRMYFCTLPSCYFKIEADLALGKESLCNVCGEPFILNIRQIKNKEPHCPDCGWRWMKDENGKRVRIQVQKGKLNAELAQEDLESLNNRLHNLTSIDEDI